MKITYENIFGLYNFMGNIFRANLDENDRAAQKVAKKYQDTGVISKDEEDWVKSYLTLETKTITKPYTKIIDEDEFRIYIVEHSKLTPIQSAFDMIYSINIPMVFEDCGSKNIFLLDKDLFLLKDMHDNIDDKLKAVVYYSMLFKSLLANRIHSFNYSNFSDNFLFTDLLGLLFYYQVSGFNLTENEFKEFKTKPLKENPTNKGAFGFTLPENQIENRIISEERKASGLFNLMKDIIRIGEIENLGIPLIPEHPVTQNNIAMEINDRIGWIRYKSAYNYFDFGTIPGHIIDQIKNKEKE